MLFQHIFPPSSLDNPLISVLVLLEFGFCSCNTWSYIIYYISTTGLLCPARKSIVTPDDEQNDLISWIPRDICADEGERRIRASLPLLLQPVMASILALDVLSTGNESEKVLRFNLRCLFLSISYTWKYLCAHPSIYIFVILPSPSSSEVISRSSVMQTFFSLTLSFFILISPCFLSSPFPPFSLLPLTPPVLVAQQLLELRDYD